MGDMRKYRIIFYFEERYHLKELMDTENAMTSLYKSIDGKICRYVFNSPEQAKEMIEREIVACKKAGIKFYNEFYYSIEPVELNIIESTSKEKIDKKLEGL